MSNDVGRSPKWVSAEAVIPWASGGTVVRAEDHTRRHTLSVQCLGGRVTLLDNAAVSVEGVEALRYGPMHYTIPLTRRQVLEHIQQQVNMQLAILALEGK